MANINPNKVLALIGKRLHFGGMKSNPTAPAQAQHSPEQEKRERRKQRGLWERRHRLNIVERETFSQLNRKYGTYTGPKK